MPSSLATRLRVLAGSAVLLSLPLAGGAEAADASESVHKSRHAAAGRLAPPVEGKTLVFGEEFDGPIEWGTKWTGDRTSAFSHVDHDPEFYNLDWLTKDAVTVHGGLARFTATPSAHTLENGKQAWDTGLITTEYTDRGFQVRAGDYIETRVQLPDGVGAWPSLWTWSVDHPEDAGNDEIDTFEYHPDGPYNLELTNHVKPDVDNYTNSDVVKPCEWITIGTYYGVDSVDWYVNGEKVFSDGLGVTGPEWESHVVMNMSVSDGTYHPAPTEPIDFWADYIRVYR
ncbi:family 16 glycosylhydrolase [Streptomyces sp. S.PB5]|uniref:glycoside hydrolase family 16 protein n=1 Tax=Streptomyces sp. S.PB5 TaxID=3020844 RepID=UPI0025B0D1A2|nr:family 16 glycosylhydrolase [Streptomyces sp. S.PB5]MDN3022813.1 family 16 glycosylhydrolase [Streptomyces sp. S.PB5]